MIPEGFIPTKLVLPPGNKTIFFILFIYSLLLESNTYIIKYIKLQTPYILQMPHSHNLR